jgi:hypothetical protein
LCRTFVLLVGATAESATGNWGLSMIARTMSVWTILSLVGVLSGVLIGHLWDRYSQETEALGFSGIYERYLANQAGFGDDAQAYRAMSHAGMVQEASALEE